MPKKYILFFALIYILTGCGTDYMLSSFYLRKDFTWPTSPSEQKSLNYYKHIAGDLVAFNVYTSPSILATPENYILAFYEVRDTPADTKVYGVDGVKNMGVYVSISKDAETFSATPVRVGTISSHLADAYGSPVSFINNNNTVIVLATGGVGFDTSSKPDEITKISVSISTNNGYKWTEWTNIIDTNMFKPLLDKGYKRFYTNPGNGTVLVNGTLVCMLDYKADGDSNPVGAAIVYSTDNGITWQLGSTITYSGHRWARVIAERSDGKLLIAAVPNTTGNVTDIYNKNDQPLAWYLADSLKGNVSSFQTSGLPNNSGGSITGDKIKYTENGISKTGILLLHSYPDRAYKNPGQGGASGTVKNAMSMSISEDNGKSWTLITNAIGGDTFDKTSFRQSMKVLKDGSIVTCIEEGERETIENSAGKTFYIVYKRMGLYALSGGKYSYEGI